MELEDFFERHKRVALLLSSGKDSAACLWMLQPWWDCLMVVWINAGNPYPEVVEYMENVRSVVPHFVEIKGNQKEWIEVNGYPVDVLPIIELEDGPQLCSVLDCCSANIWNPMMNFLHTFGFTGVIRGNRLSDKHTDRYKHEDFMGEIQFFHPVEKWTDEQIFEYLGPKLPKSYKRGVSTSLDCLNCTAFVYDNGTRIKDLESVDPKACTEVRRVHSYLKSQLIAHASFLE